MRIVTDIKYAFRLLTKSPIFTLLTIVMLAGGLGVSILTYSFINTAMFKPLPLENGDAIVKLYASDAGQRRLLDAYEFSQIRDEATGLVDLGAYIDSNVLVTRGDVARSFAATVTQWDMFGFTSTQPALGRGFQPGDSDVNGQPVVVISHRVWENFFDSDRSIVDQVVEIDGVGTQVIGVMPEGYGFPVASDLWMPISSALLNPSQYGQHTLSVYGRIAESSSRDEVDTQINRIVQRVQNQHALESDVDRLQSAAFVQTLQEAQVPDGLPLFIALYALSGFILLLAAINAGNLLLARATARRQETAIRVALGAPRKILIMQMMWEGIIICLVSGVFAILLAGWALQLVDVWAQSKLAGGLAFWWTWSLDLPTVIGALFLIVATLFVAGFLPAWTASSGDFNAILRDGSKGAQGRGVGKITRALVVLQVVLISVIIFVGAVLGLGSHSLTNAEFGINTDRALAAPTILDGERYPDHDSRLLYFTRLQNFLSNESSIRSSTLMCDLTDGETTFAIEGVEYQLDTDYPTSYAKSVSSNLKSIGIELRAGRYFDDRDQQDGAAVALLSESLAKRHWPNASPVGQRVKLLDENNQGTWVSVVGVVSDVLNGNPLSKRRSTNTIYRPITQLSGPGANLIVKYQGDEQNARSTLYQSMSRIDPLTQPEQVVNFEEMLRQSAVFARSATDVLLKSGLFAMLLAITGIYGLTANAVTRRTREIGIRRALGSTDSRIIKLLLVQGSKQLITGLGIAFVIALLLSALLSRFLVIDPWAYVIVGVLVFALISVVVLLAVYIPASRTVKLEPASALRYE